MSQKAWNIYCQILMYFDILNQNFKEGLLNYKNKEIALEIA